MNQHDKEKKKNHEPSILLLFCPKSGKSEANSGNVKHGEHS